MIPDLGQSLPGLKIVNHISLGDFLRRRGKQQVGWGVNLFCTDTRITVTQEQRQAPEVRNTWWAKETGNHLILRSASFLINIPSLVFGLVSSFWSLSFSTGN